MYVKPPDDILDDETKCWKLVKCAYGLSEASRMWYNRVLEVFTHIGLVRSQCDPAVFIYRINGVTNGILLTHVDDFLYGGSREFLNEVVPKIKEFFDIREEQMNNFKFCGINIKTINCDDGTFKIIYSCTDKIQFLNKIQLEKDDDTTYATVKQESEFRSLLGSLQWMSDIARPDISFGISSLLGHVKDLTLKDCVMANKLLRKAKGCEPFHVSNLSLNMDDLHLVVYCDASFGNLRDNGSQAGYVSFLVDSKNMNVLEYKSRRIKRICRSTFGAELLSCNEAVDQILYIRDFLCELGLVDLKVKIFSDNKSLKDNLNSLTSNPQEKRLRIELANLRDLLASNKISINWIAGSDQLADVLTKEMNGDKLLDILSKN